MSWRAGLRTWLGYLLRGCEHTRTTLAYLHEASGGGVRAMEWCKHCGAMRFHERDREREGYLRPLVWNRPALLDLLRES